MESSETTVDVTQETGMEVEASEDAASEKMDSKKLDLAFAMDCTGSMGSYIKQAQQNIRLIVEEIVSKEKADVRLALVEYRDHPPQDSTFVTRVNDFTSSVRTMKQWLDKCSASGGGDTPEAVADALHQVKKLQWRDDSTKICVFIADAPPHGLSRGGDHFPNGCPEGFDPMVVTRELAEKGITLYMVGCEPSITPYKDFFMALAHLTGGQYVPLARADVLAKVIVGGAQEEMSLQLLMEEVNREVVKECAAAGDADIDSEALTRKVHSKLKSKGNVRVKQLQMNKSCLAPASRAAEELSYADTMHEVQDQYQALPQQQEMSLSGSAPKSRSARKKKSSRMFSFFKKERSASHDEAPPMVACYSEESERMEDIPQDYAVVEEELNEAQASRLVKKSIAMNHYQTKMKK